MHTYRSKIGPGIAIPIGVIMGAVAVILAYEKLWPVLAFVLLLCVLIAHLFLTTSYEVSDTVLRVRAGFLVDSRIRIDSIKEIKETSSILSAPALSMDRLLVTYKKFDSIVISPKDKAAFIAHLLRINPSIKITVKENS